MGYKKNIAGPKKSANQVISDAIADVMDRDGKVPWKWDPGRWEIGDPMNWERKTGYNGWNYLFLKMVTSETGEFLTFNQVNKAGGRVKKRPEDWVGPWGYPIMKWIPWNETKKRAWKEGDDPKKDKKGMIPKSYYVFEVNAQTEGITPKREVVPSTARPIELVEEAETFIKKFSEATGLKIQNRNGTPCYVPALHVVYVPAPKFFKSTARYYETVFHECVHSTIKAMGRKAEGGFGSEVYSEEEIVAEVGSMLLSMKFGFASEPEDMKNQAIYVHNWAKKIRENPNWLRKGASDAEKAVKFMLEKGGIAVEPEQPTTATAAEQSSIVTATDEAEEPGDAA